MLFLLYIFSFYLVRKRNAELLLEKPLLEITLIISRLTFIIKINIEFGNTMNKSITPRVETICYII